MSREPRGLAADEGADVEDASSTRVTPATEEGEPRRLSSGTRPAVRMEDQPTRRMAPFMAQMLAGPPPARAASPTIPAIEEAVVDEGARETEPIAAFASVPRVLVVDLPDAAPEPRVHDPAAVTVPAAAFAPDGTARDVAAPAPIVRPRRGASRAVTIGAVLAVLVVGAAWGVRSGLLRWPVRTAPANVATPPAAPLEPLVAAPVVAVPTPAVAPSPPSEATIPADMGRLDTLDMAAGRRIFVDDHVAAQTPESVLVKCGTHTVQIGSNGRRQTYDVPCGEPLRLRDR